MNANTSDRCREVGDFLRSRRLRLTPREVGLPNGTRRRVSGLRREEVAYLADIGITWYTWLEQGRPIAIATETLDRLAAALRLNRTESCYLATLVRTHRIGPGHWRDAVPAHIHRLLAAFDEPACVCNPRTDLLAWNDAHEQTYGFSKDPGSTHNMMWRLFCDVEYQRCFVDWKAVARLVVHTFRSRYAEYVGEPLFESLIDELLQASPDFKSLWAELEISSPASMITDVVNHCAEHVRYDVVSLPVPDSPGQAVALHVRIAS
ncbi:MAG TPA: helix-turn-helix transcriptional regulator [Candidatus Baltobacteraceae bacterium]|jgi:PAS domain-containing protein|nr:helix-turn-helix transcriptional regulator [Candidatus Baltobacteraceae bacterium]